jgi:hypothetical protein
MYPEKTRPKCCRSCGADLSQEPDPIPLGQRCSKCQTSFEAWLRGESPTVYVPRRDGVWADLQRLGPADEK